jgi:hypothetical protein
VDIRDTVEAARYLRELLREKNLRGRYKHLIQAVTQAGQNQEPEKARTQFDELRDILIRADLSDRSAEEREFLEDFGVGNVVGPAAAQRLEQIFRNNPANHQAIVAELQKLMPEVDSVNQRVEALINGLTPLLDQPRIAKTETESKDEGRLWLRFDSKVSVDTMKDLENWSKEWVLILHHFCRVVPGSDPRARLIHIRKRSPLVIEVAAAVAVLAPLTFGVNRVVASLGRIIELRKKYEELKQMKIKTSVLEVLAEEIKEDRQSLATKAADEIQARFQCDHEARNASETALKSVVKFIEGGGELDVKIAEQPGKQGEEPIKPGIDGKTLQSLISGMRRDLLALPEYHSEDGEATPNDEGTTPPVAT